MHTTRPSSPRWPPRPSPRPLWPDPTARSRPMPTTRPTAGTPASRRSNLDPRHEEGQHVRSDARPRAWRRDRAERRAAHMAGKPGAHRRLPRGRQRTGSAPRLGLCGHRCRRRYRSLRDRARTHRRIAPPTHRTARSLTTRKPRARSRRAVAPGPRPPSLHVRATPPRDTVRAIPDAISMMPPSRPPVPSRRSRDAIAPRVTTQADTADPTSTPAMRSETRCTCTPLPVSLSTSAPAQQRVRLVPSDLFLAKSRALVRPA